MWKFRLIMIKEFLKRLTAATWIIATIFTAKAFDGAAIQVLRWQPQDFPFTNRAALDNPFTVSFSAEVKDPEGKSFSLPGFFDGGDIWKIRVSPTVAGEWSLVTHSSVPALDGQRAQFVCTPNSSPNAHGGVMVDQQHPFHFVHEDGTRYFPLGYECDWLWALDATNPALPNVNRFLDKIAASGFNYVIMNAYAHDTTWRRGKTSDDDFGPPPLYAWEGTNEKPDHSRLNLVYWRHYDQVIAALNNRGMVAHILIKVYNKMVNWPVKGSAGDDLYFRWLVARYAAYPNVHWDFSKESNNDRDLDYKLGRMKFIRDNDPYHRPITTHTDQPAYDSGAYNDILDYRSDQVHGNWHASLLNHRQQKTWPVINTEFGYEHGPLGTNDLTYRVGQPKKSAAALGKFAWRAVIAPITTPIPHGMSSAPTTRRRAMRISITCAIFLKARDIG